MSKNKAPARITQARAFVNKLAPEHERISCSDAAKAEGGPRSENVDMNSRYSDTDFGGCYRCTLMSVMNLTLKGELANEEEDED